MHNGVKRLRRAVYPGWWLATTTACLIGLAWTAALPAADESPAGFRPPVYNVLRPAGPMTIDGKLDEPSWIAAPAIGNFVFPWWKSGKKEQTVAKLLWDDENLYVACICEDAHITARTTDRDGPVAADDCFEVMLAPDPARPDVYFNLEWNVIGGLIDNHRPNGPQRPKAPRWDAEGVKVAGTAVGTLNEDGDQDERWIAEVAIPLRNFQNYAASIPPRPGTCWNVNLNRHGGQTNAQYSQWSPGDTPLPSFHTPHRFGQIVFSDVAVPTGHARLHALLPIEAESRMKVPAGLRVREVAAEPEVRQPILVKCDDRGRLWVIQYLQYPNPAGLERRQVDRYSRTTYDRIPEPPPRGPQGADKITICEDTDGDGRADRFRDFVTGLNLCTGLAFGHGGVFVLQVPYLLFYPDRDRNDVPDGDPEVLLTGFGMEDAQSLASHLTWGPDGWLYGVNGSTTTCNIRGIEFQQGVWRYQPLTRDFELFSEGGGNLFGVTFDAHGNLIFTSNGGDLCMHAVQGAYFRKAFGKHGPLHNPYTFGYFADIKKSTPVVGGPCAGGSIYLGDRFPAPFHGAFMCSDFLGHTCSWWMLRPLGSTFEAVRGGVLLDSQDPWFGATDTCQGPEGALYVSDFHDKRTAHPDPDADWDRDTGRIYRIEAVASEPLARIDLAKRTSDELVELLHHPNRWYSEQARGLLAERRDSTVHAALRERALHASEPEWALHGLWALHVSGGLHVKGGWNEELAAQLLRSPHESVRTWTVRLLGDQRHVSQAIGRQLSELAAADPSVVVRCQLASTAKRLPSRDGLPIVERLLDRDLDDDDPYIPWLVWWALENQAIADRDAILALCARSSAWEKGSWRGNLRRLIRRYAAEGNALGYDACLRLLETTPAPEISSMLEALGTGLTQRGELLGGMGLGDLYRSLSSTTPAAPVSRRSYEPVSDPLRQLVERFWKDQPDEPGRVRVAIQSGVNPARTRAVASAADPRQPVARREALLAVLGDFPSDTDVESLASLVTPQQPESIQRAALGALGGASREDLASRLLAAYPQLAPEIQARVRDLLVSRPQGVARLLEAVERGDIKAADIPLEQVRRVALHQREELDALVRKHWGRLSPGTSEEKLATMRRFNNDLRAASGNRANGKLLFTKHCAKCHRLFEEGEKVGPDLTNSSRQDTEFLLVSLVDPSAVVRRDYLASTITTTQGQVFTGLIVDQSGGQITLVDSQGQRRQLNRDDIEELQDSSISLMPDRQLETLTPQELRDLFSYLQGK